MIQIELGNYTADYKEKRNFLFVFGHFRLEKDLFSDHAILRYMIKLKLKGKIAKLNRLKMAKSSRFLAFESFYISHIYNGCDIPGMFTAIEYFLITPKLLASRAFNLYFNDIMFRGGSGGGGGGRSKPDFQNKTKTFFRC